MINVCLIGLGRIGYEYDSDLESLTELSHVKAIYRNKNFKLKYAVDNDTNKLSQFQKVFPQVSCTLDWKELSSKNDFELLVIALPTSLHFDCLQSFRKSSSLKAVILEKPAFDNSQRFFEVEKTLNEKTIVNYYRRFLPELSALSDRIKQREWGVAKKIICKYSKGFKHNGSHMVDLLHFLFEKITVGRISHGHQISDFWEKDPIRDINVELDINGSPAIVQFLGIDQRICTVFSMEIFFEKALIIIEDEKIKIHRYIDDPNYPGYTIVSDLPEVIEINVQKAMGNLYSYVDSFFNHNVKNISSLYSEQTNDSFIASLVK